MSKLDRKLFFDAVRPSIFGGALSQLQVKGTEAVLDSCERYGIKRLEWTAYVLANTHHETAGTMQPIREYGGDSWLTQMYDIRGARPDKAKELGNINPGDGVRYAGGGFTMLTGRNNYKKQGDKHNVDLVNDPELVLIDYDLSADIMVSGMLDGDFTGKKLADYDLPDGGFDALGARRIVNGYQKPKIVNGVEIDKPHARLIVATYELFLNALTVSYSRDKAVEAGPSSPAGTVGTSSPVGPHIPVDQDGGIDWGVVERGMGEAIKSGENVGFDFAQVSAGKATAPNVKIWIITTSRSVTGRLLIRILVSRSIRREIRCRDCWAGLMVRKRIWG